MRILLLTDRYLPHRGGSRVYYHNLLKQFDGAEVHVATSSEPGDREFDRAQPYTVSRCRLSEAPWLRPLRLQAAPVYFRLLLHTYRAMRSFRPDIILAGELVPTGPVAALLARVFRRPLIVFTHAEGPSTLARTRFQSRLSKWVCGRARKVIAASENAAQGLIEHFGIPEDKIQVILPAIGEEHFDERYLAHPFQNVDANQPTAANHPPRAPRLLSVGRLIARKGHLTVLRALGEVTGKFPDLRYTIAGTGPMESEIRAAIEAHALQRNVRLIGKQSQTDLLELYAGSDLFVLPNADDPATGDTEGFVIVFGEASAHGLPVIGGLDGGTQASIHEGQTGLRIDGRDPCAVARAILEILDDPSRAQALGRAGREFALRDLRWETRAEVLKETLKQIV